MSACVHVFIYASVHMDTSCKGSIAAVLLFSGPAHRHLFRNCKNRMLDYLMGLMPDPAGLFLGLIHTYLCSRCLGTGLDFPGSGVVGFFCPNALPGENLHFTAEWE